MKEQEKNRRDKASGGSKKEDGAFHMGHGFRRVHILIDRFFARSWEDNRRDLTRVQCSTLGYLYDHRDMSIYQKDIEAVFSITGATASNILKGLERQGVIERIPVAEDARLKRILLTREGEALHEQAIRNIERLERAIVAGMTEEEIAAYRDFLGRTVLNLEKLVGENRAEEDGNAGKNT